MKKRTNIDDLYREKLKDFSEIPPEESWKNIAKTLKKKDNRKAGILPLWYKLAGAAAVAVILMGAFWFFNNPFQHEPGVVFDIDENALPQIELPGENRSLEEASEELERNNSTSGENSNSSDNQSQIAEISEEKSAAKKSQNQFAENSVENSGTSKNSGRERSSESEIAGINSETKEQFTQAEDEKSTEIKNTETQLAETTNSTSEEEEETPATTEQEALASLGKNPDPEAPETENKNGQKLRVTPFAAPVVYNNLGSGNAIDASLAASPTQSEVTVAYGVNLAYSISDKIKIRTGIGKVNMSYHIQDVNVSATLQPSAIANIDFNEQNQNIQLRSALSNSLQTSSTSMFPGNSVMPSYAEINQQFGFIEVPVEIEYALLDSRLGVNIIGGASSLFLEENAVFLNSNNQRDRLGSANNINELSFSTNIGLGVNYELIDNFSLNLEPIFKYQLNTFNNTSDMQPYFFGIYSGLSFKF
ncbi:hypothetical protein ACW6QP_00705 [Salegentibacter sp. HM20]